MYRLSTPRGKCHRLYFSRFCPDKNRNNLSLHVNKDITQCWLFEKFILNFWACFKFIFFPLDSWSVFFLLLARLLHPMSLTLAFLGAPKATEFHYSTGCCMFFQNLKLQRVVCLSSITVGCPTMSCIMDLACLFTHSFNRSLITRYVSGEDVNMHNVPPLWDAEELVSESIFKWLSYSPLPFP